ncbi:hypothetical protein BKA69DRAFT_1109382 [Paraphysoderma sedebokerense]|nr:hypothetical protein BKA69DRAFT_1109382 [Paraphysoderma sedebokerense]
MYAGIVVGSVAFTISYRTNPPPQYTPDPSKKTLVVLGSGWGATSFISKLDTSEYNVVVVSPRNFFLYTPLLPSVTTGSVESRSIMTPIRYFTRFKPFAVNVVEAECTDIDIKTKTVEISDNSEITGEVSKTRIPYDYLVVSVGAENQTFGIKGVREHAHFLKEVWDAHKIRTRIMDCLETATFPHQPEKEIERLLHMVVVGGGPTGVEYAGELYDFLIDEIQKWYPEIAGKVKITLIEALPNVLPMFSKQMIEYTEQSFKEANITIMNNTAVKEVHAKQVVVEHKDGNRETLPYGLLVWATGNTARPLTRALMSKLPEQDVKRGIKVDDYLKVAGTNDVYAIGDCTATKFAPTAQVASQQGKYLAKLFNEIAIADRVGRDISYKPFSYVHKATLAYIGDDKSVADIKFPFDFSLAGFSSFLFWRSAYLSNLFTMRNKVLVAFDWMKQTLFGRDISRD